MLEFWAPMSALGQKRTSEHVQVMSALPPKADISLPESRPGLEHSSTSVTPYKSVTVRTSGSAVSVVNLRLRDAASTLVNVTVGKRSREYLTDREVERLIEAAKQNRSGHRDAAAIRACFNRRKG